MKETIFKLVLTLVGIALLVMHQGAAPGYADEQSWQKLIEEAVANGDYAAALDYLSRLEIDQPDNPELKKARVQLLNSLGNSYYRDRDLSRARDTFLEALDLNPRNYLTLMMLGEIAYYSQRLDEARRYWEAARNLRPGDPRIVDRLRKLSKEEAIESKLDASQLANFDIRFHARAPGYKVYDIESYLLEAYQEIGYDFNYYPVRSIVVLLYTAHEFSKLRDTPYWVGALYDGKIRLPVSGERLSAADIKKILWHEYTHALINDETGNNCPRWLHEGLAQCQEAKVVPVDEGPLRYALRHDGLIPLSQLDRAFGFDQPPRQVHLAYAQAYSLVDYLIQRYGFWRINVILGELKKGKNWKLVFEDELLMPISELEKEWISQL
ncbi:MAG: tetratricopeptide repeat protein [Candidatus Euphemobacter frigidus]|nr:tetratricopeptide repeat protein [Candidatus Euphemobacter frigidus]MDP8275454.1 tetratricopeptide repeat protein [Candidatus Euphemobacter frigidus]